MPTITIPEELAARIAAAGEDLNRFAIAALTEKIEEEAKPRTFADLMAEGKFVLPEPVQGTPRADGRPWSEIEAACDPC